MKTMHLERPVNSHYWSLSKDWTYVGQVIRTTEVLLYRAINFVAREFYSERDTCISVFDQENTLIGKKNSIKDHLTYV